MTRSASSPTFSPHHADFEAGSGGGMKKSKKKDKAAGDLQLYDLYHLMLSYSPLPFASFFIFVLRLSLFAFLFFVVSTCVSCSVVRAVN